MSVRDGYKMTELGEIPQEWEVNNAGSMFETVSIKNCPNEKVLTVTQDRGTIYRDDCGINIKTMDDSLKNFKLVQHGNFIISLRSFQGGIEYSTLRGIVSPAYTILTNTKPISDGFYKYFYKSEKFITLLDSAVIGIRDGKQISYEVFKNLKLPYPPLSEQQRIAEILSSNDALITKTDELIEKTKEVKQGLMQELLTKGIGHTEFKDSELGRIPKEWEVKKLGDLGDIITGSTPKTSDAENYGNDYMWVSPADMGTNKYILKTKSMLSEKGFKLTRKLPKGSVLVTCIGSTIGKMGIAGDILSTNQQINSIVCSEKYNSEFVYYALNYRFINYMDFVSTQAVPIINKTTFSLFEVIIPPLSEQLTIVGILSSIDEKIDVLEKRKQLLEEIKQGLMQDLLTGRIRVNLN